MCGERAGTRSHHSLAPDTRQGWTGGCAVDAPLPRGGDLVEWVGESWIRWILKVSAVTLEASGLDNVQPGQPHVFMSNHQRVFDVAAIVTTLPVYWRFVAKRELTWVPFFGWALKLGGHVIVDRCNRQRSIRSLARSADQIRAGTNVILFPEGTRSTSGRMGEFKSGGFHLAIEAGVPILPVSVMGSDAVTPKGSFRIEGGHVRVAYGKPIPTAGLGVEARHGFKEEVGQAISEGMLA